VAIYCRPTSSVAVVVGVEAVEQVERSAMDSRQAEGLRNWHMKIQSWVARKLHVGERERLAAKAVECFFAVLDTWAGIACVPKGY